MMTEPSLYDVQYDCLWRQDVEEEMLDEQIRDAMSAGDQDAVNLIGSALNEIYCNTAHCKAFEKAILDIYNTFTNKSAVDMAVSSAVIRVLLQKQLRKLIKQKDYA